ncbi:hypothetical protein [Pseudoalteromonas luteoviolacea]|uniref:Uncharacterized protein n=1 Tax=Pseudoalteromonas luteoviolacea DSM 6061 TaxID=1365250 RepID=A0A167A5G4_9GAMM|nr:hypothetical protein [Pseudoalteromonas luteoviolacea]KZN45004.1 hypothetical protein N475_25830 [Pseudoalteromonas luteoviolacea DSM 6061]MBE0386417.1 hypothetical protein [Pseudoalteromonas luteoviolacea DSM 6061]
MYIVFFKNYAAILAGAIVVIFGCIMLYREYFSNYQLHEGNLTSFECNSEQKSSTKGKEVMITFDDNNSYYIRAMSCDYFNQNLIVGQGYSVLTKNDLLYSIRKGSEEIIALNEKEKREKQNAFLLIFFGLISFFAGLSKIRKKV